MSNAKSELYALGACFDGAASLYHAAEKVRDKGFKNWDVHTPFPVHGMDDAMGLGRSRVSTVSLIGGATGLTIAYLMIWWTSLIDFPLIAHGKPYFSLEPSVPIFFELTVLCTAFFTLFGMLIFNRLPRLNHPVFNWDTFKRVSTDGFFLVIEATDAQFNEEKTRRFLEEIGGKNISPIYHDS
jgi:hypothetical protein